MMKRSLLLARFGLSILIASAAFIGCGPSIDPAARADIDRRVAALGRSGGPRFETPTTFSPRPFVVGQWTQHRMTDDKGQPSFMTYKVVGEEGGAFWIETVHEAYVGKTITKILASFGNRMDPHTIEVRAAKLRDKDGHVNEVTPEMMPFMQAMWRGALQGLVVSWQGQPQEDAAVPAGTFVACYKMRTDVSWGPWHGASMSWSHPAIPLSGMARSQGIDSPTSMELVAFGETGAQSELP